jgi:hypothetical protein
MSTGDMAAAPMEGRPLLSVPLLLQEVSNPPKWGCKGKYVCVRVLCVYVWKRGGAGKDEGWEMMGCEFLASKAAATGVRLKGFGALTLEDGTPGILHQPGCSSHLGRQLACRG